ncbi:hypothetical protein [Pseudomonas sp. p106]|uniref:hypothetical protein n=1 Tax=Pseudomonas sp. p106 TaxID=2479854 RepID=UPI000F79101D|nr:hypothetical protein [Pseudomonas sp. p106]RRV40103.1 hypothetical protein EGJ09_25040 [Pseudomonas sp. p106]
MFIKKPNLVNIVAVVATIASLGVMSGCKDDENTVPASANTNAKSSVKSDELAFDELNSTFSAKFENPGQGAPDSYLDILNPAVGFGLYNNLRNWEESGQDIAELLKTSVLGEAESSEVFKLGREYDDATDEFKKRDLSEQILAQTKVEASKVDGNRLVRFLSVPGQQAALKLSKYNFEEKNFKIDHCLFSDKLQYSKDEQRIAQNLKGADQERCYFRTSNTELKIGFVGGSNVRLKVEDPELARKIAAEKDSLRIEVFGYVDSVQRDKVGGALVKERRVLISPQKLVLIGADRNVILETKI